MSATSDDVLHAVDASRDALQQAIGAVRGSVSTVATEVQSLSQRVTAIEARAKKHESEPPPPMAAPPELEDLREEIRRDRAERRARSVIKLEAQAAEAEEHVRAERRRKAIMFALGALFTIAQILTIARAAFH